MRRQTADARQVLNNLLLGFYLSKALSLTRTVFDLCTKTLEDHFKNEVDEADISHILMPILQSHLIPALKFLHEQEICHGDIKVKASFYVRLAMLCLETKNGSLLTLAVLVLLMMMLWDVHILPQNSESERYRESFRDYRLRGTCLLWV
jgi:serine/threonine protein kinase